MASKKTAAKSGNGHDKYKAKVHYDEVGKYHQRLIENGDGLRYDLREFVESDTYSGYTRRGITLRSKAQVKKVIAALRDASKHLPSKVEGDE